MGKEGKHREGNRLEIGQKEGINDGKEGKRENIGNRRQKKEKDER